MLSAFLLRFKASYLEKCAWLSPFFIVDSNSPCKYLLFPRGPNLAQKRLYLVGTALSGIDTNPQSWEAPIVGSNQLTAVKESGEISQSLYRSHHWYWRTPEIEDVVFFGIGQLPYDVCFPNLVENIRLKQRRDLQKTDCPVGPRTGPRSRQM